MLRSLTRIADFCGTQKGSIHHGYTDFYEKYLHKFRNEKFSMMEFGINYGHSINMWLTYFSNARVHGVDNFKQGAFLEEPDLAEDVMTNNIIDTDRFIPHIADESDQKHMEIAKSVLSDDLYFIIDDGSHIGKYQQQNLGRFFEKVKYYYIIEDLHTKRNHMTKRTIEVLKWYNKTGSFNSEVITKKQRKYLEKNISRIDIYKDKAAVIIKKDNILKV